MPPPPVAARPGHDVVDGLAAVLAVGAAAVVAGEQVLPVQGKGGPVGDPHEAAQADHRGDGHRRGRRAEAAFARGDEIRLVGQHEDDGATAVVFEWRVRTTRWWMNLLAPLARPAFRWNHDRLMRAGGRGLAGRLGVELLSGA